jgi:single-strand DNA-binding protein
MSSQAKVRVVGHLGSDPVIQHGGTDQAVCKFSVAAEVRFKEDGEWKAETQWYNVVTFKKDAENCALALNKGSQVLVEGTQRVRLYQKDGATRFSIDVVADIRGVLFLGKKGDAKPAAKNGQAAVTTRDDSEIPF